MKGYAALLSALLPLVAAHGPDETVSAASPVVAAAAAPTSSAAAAPQGLAGLLGGLFGGNAATPTPAAPAASASAPAAPAAPADPAHAAAGGQCKVYNSDAAWPKAADWAAAMPEVQAVARPATPLEATHPDYRLDAESVKDVQAAVNFAAKNNVRFSVLNSGHDFLGRNDAPAGLAIVVNNLKGVRVAATFNPTAKGEAPVTSATKTNVINTNGKEGYVTFGAGWSTQALNDQLAPSNLFTLGAAHGEVSVAGGWAQTAGHTPLGPRYGLGADQAVEYQVVTADGQLRIANKNTNSDLFWALRGGGGGTFGVVVQATIKAHPSPKMVAAQFFVNTTNLNDQKSIFAPAGWLHQQMPDLMDKGMSGYYYLFPNAIKFIGLSADREGTIAWANQTYKPLLEKFVSYPGIDKATASYAAIEFHNYKDFFDYSFGSIELMEGMDMRKRAEKEKRDAAAPGLREFFQEWNNDQLRVHKRHGPGEEAGVQAGGILPMDSRLMTKEGLKNANIAAVLESAMPKMELAQLRGNMVGGGKVFSLGSDTSVLPAWRKAYVHLIQTGNGLPESKPLRDITPGSGAYANEASMMEPAWKETFWGSNYNKLSQLKDKYDPNGVFWVTPGINADKWKITNNKLCRVDTATANSAITDPNAPPPSNDVQNLGSGSPDADGPAFPVLRLADGKLIPNPLSKEQDEWRKTPSYVLPGQQPTGALGAGAGGPNPTSSQAPASTPAAQLPAGATGAGAGAGAPANTGSSAPASSAAMNLGPLIAGLGGGSLGGGFANLGGLGNLQLPNLGQGLNLPNLGALLGNQNKPASSAAGAAPTGGFKLPDLGELLGVHSHASRAAEPATVAKRHEPEPTTLVTSTSATLMTMPDGTVMTVKPKARRHEPDETSTVAQTVMTMPDGTLMTMDLRRKHRRQTTTMTMPDGTKMTMKHRRHAPTTTMTMPDGTLMTMKPKVKRHEPEETSTHAETVMTMPDGTLMTMDLRRKYRRQSPTTTMTMPDGTEMTMKHRRKAPTTTMTMPDGSLMTMKPRHEPEETSTHTTTMTMPDGSVMTMKKRHGPAPVTTSSSVSISATLSSVAPGVSVEPVVDIDDGLEEEELIPLVRVKREYRGRV